MIRPEDVTDAMVDAAFGDLLDGTGNANWGSRPNREIMRGALARAINASGCVLVPKDPWYLSIGVRVTQPGEWPYPIKDAKILPGGTAVYLAADPREQAQDICGNCETAMPKGCRGIFQDEPECRLHKKTASQPGKEKGDE